MGRGGLVSDIRSGGLGPPAAVLTFGATAQAVTVGAILGAIAGQGDAGVVKVNGGDLADDQDVFV